MRTGSCPTATIMTTTRQILRCIYATPANANNVFLWSVCPKYRQEPIRSRYPWVTIGAVRWLSTFLKREDLVFEWGSGGSTLFWGSRTKAVVTIEHDRSWFNHVQTAISSARLTNCDIRLREPDGDEARFGASVSGSSTTYSSSFPPYEHVSFRRYVTEIDMYPDSFFDLISVDGRSRPSCITHAVKKVKPGGALLLDNSERTRYQASFELLQSWHRIDFTGPGIGPTFNVWSTTVWIKPNVEL